VVDQNFDVPNSLVERITPAGRLFLVAGVVDRSGPPTPGPATRSELDFPSGVAVDPHGDLFIADSGNDDVERVTPAGRLSVVAGIVGKSGPPTPGSATRSELDFPSGVAVDPHGDLFIADTRNNVVEKVTPGGRLSIVAGIVGKSGPPTPGPANGSRLDFFDPSGVAIDSHGDLFIADGGNHVVEEVSPAGRLSVVAGIVGKSGPPTPGPATRSELSQPDAVAVDAHGDVLIADRLNDVVEKVTPAGDLSVIAGVVGDTGLPTPGPAIRSELNPPNGLAVDSRGNLFISDYFSNLVEEVKA
jgi:secreted PhoX family phosphatase